jgi:hypothetical protein
MINYEQINKILQELDIEGLLELGAPEDEYEDEAKQIANEIAAIKKLNETILVEKIIELWSENFGPFDENDIQNRMREFERLSEEILKLAKKLN